MKTNYLTKALLLVLMSSSAYAQNALSFDGIDDRLDVGKPASLQISIRGIVRRRTGGDKLPYSASILYLHAQVAIDSGR